MFGANKLAQIKENPLNSGTKKMKRSIVNNADNELFELNNLIEKKNIQESIFNYSQKLLIKINFNQTIICSFSIYNLVNLK